MSILLDVLSVVCITKSKGACAHTQHSRCINTATTGYATTLSCYLRLKPMPEVCRLLQPRMYCGVCRVCPQATWQQLIAGSCS
jgi:hypothetical protein